MRAQFLPSIFRPPVFDPRNQDFSVEFFHGAASCAARLVTCKPPICVRGACHHSAPPKARVDQGQSGTSQNRSRRCQAVGLSGQAPSIAPVLAASAACAFIWDAELKSLKVWPPKAARSAEAQDFRAAQERLLLSSLLSLFFLEFSERIFSRLRRTFTGLGPLCVCYFLLFCSRPAGSGLGRVILTTREHVVAIEAHGKGLLGITLRYPYEIRNEADYFGDLRDARVPKEMLDLAAHIVATRFGRFHPEKFEDRYEHALRELIKRKQRGEKIAKPSKRPPAKVIDLMEALRQSAAVGRGAARRPLKHASAEHKRGRARRSTAQARKAS